MQYIFDLDGTLVDTHGILRTCYEKAGAPPPEDFYNRSGWREWATEEQHELKNAHYALYILTHGVNPLPMMDLYRSLLKVGEVCEIWTGASFPAVQALRISIPDLIVHRGSCGMTIHDKVKRLNAEVANAARTMTIFDDSEVACKEFQTVRGVSVCHVRY